MAEHEIDTVLSFLKEWRSAREVKDRFGLSDVQGVKLFRWLRKVGLIDVCKGYEEGFNFDIVTDEFDGRVYYYKAKNN